MCVGTEMWSVLISVHVCVLRFKKCDRMCVGTEKVICGLRMVTWGSQWDAISGGPVPLSLTSEKTAGNKNRTKVAMMLQVYPTFTSDTPLPSHTHTPSPSQKLLEKEHCEENILFWRDAEEFKQNAPQMKNVRETHTHTHTHTLWCVGGSPLIALVVYIVFSTSKASAKVAVSVGRMDVQPTNPASYKPFILLVALNHKSFKCECLHTCMYGLKGVWLLGWARVPRLAAWLYITLLPCLSWDMQ